MRALMLVEVGHLELVDLAEPEPGPSEVVMEVAFAGVCGSDVHSARDGGLLRQPPIVMGHELSGTVGSRRVAVNPMIVCDTCDMCAAGLDHLCRRRSIVGIQRPGGFAARVAVPADSLVEVPSAVPLEAAAMIEPLAVALHGFRLGAPAPGLRIGILGAGTIGLMLAWLASRQTEHVTVAEPEPSRRRLAARLQAVTTTPRLEGEHDAVFDAAGTADSHRDSLARLRPGGTAVWVGNESPDAAFDAQVLVRVEHRIIGSAAYGRADFEDASRLIGEDVLEWATVRPLEEGVAVFESLMDPHPDQPVKVLLQP